MHAVLLGCSEAVALLLAAKRNGFSLQDVEAELALAQVGEGGVGGGMIMAGP